MLLFRVNNVVATTAIVSSSHILSGETTPPRHVSEAR